MRLAAALLTVSVLLVAAVSGCGGDADATGGTVTVSLAELTQSGQSGTATLSPMGEGRTAVTIEVTSPTAHDQPAHIHPGTCADLDPLPAYPLAPVRKGRSSTTVAATIGDLRRGDFALNVHLSEEEIRTSVACGDIR